MTKKFRKQLHIAHKEKMVTILLQYGADFLENINEFSEDPEKWTIMWVNKTFLPMGDFSKEDALNEIDAWKE